MAQFVLRYGGSEPATPANHVQSILAIPGVKVIDQSTNMLLVDGSQADLKQKVAELPGWSMHPYGTVPLPDTRQKIR